MTYTAETVLAEITEDERKEMLAALEASPDLPHFMKKTPQVENMWIAGCWLGRKLETAKCPDEERESICFAHGQRCLFGNAYAAAAEAWNAYVAGTPEYGGEELAHKINETHIKIVQGE